MTPRIIFLVVLRTLLIAWAYGAPALRLYRTLKIVPHDTQRARQLLFDYLFLLLVGIQDAVMWGVLLMLPVLVPEEIRLQPWYLPTLTALWLGETVPFIVAGWRLGRVLEPDGEEGAEERKHDKDAYGHSEGGK